MTTYFDHFIVTQIISNYFTDSLMILFSTISLYIIINKLMFLVPGSFQVMVEVMVNHWKSVVLENLGFNKQLYMIPLLSLFFFIFGMNLLGFFTYTFPVTTHVFLTFGMAFSIWFGMVMFGFFSFSLSFLSIFMPSGAPLLLSPLLVIMEVASNVSSPMALGMSLAANLTAGHILMAMLSDFSYKLMLISCGLSVFFPVLIIMFMTMLEIGVLVIQAYVFCLLSMIYLKDSLILH